MKRTFRIQQIAYVLYIIMAVIVFFYALAFVTEYSDLFGLRLPANIAVANFYEGILQVFNRQIFLWALVEVTGILLLVMLEVHTKVPDLFALVVVGFLLIACCCGAVYAISNIAAISSYYRGLDFSSMYLEGIEDYQLKFTTFTIGTVLYIVNFIVCGGFAVVCAVSHFKFKKLWKEGQTQ